MRLAVVPWFPWWIVAVVSYAVTVIAAAQLAHEFGWFRRVPKWRQAVAYGLVFVLLASPLLAFDIFAQCDWPTLEAQYGYAGAWVMWLAAGCY